jgi:hypothetical protein
LLCLLSLQLEALALVCTSLRDVRSVCAAVCTSSSARKAILAKCSSGLQLEIAQMPAEDEHGSNPEAAAAALQRFQHQAALLAEYGTLVGKLQLKLNFRLNLISSLPSADAAGLQAALQSPLHLRHVQHSSSTAALLQQLEPSHLTRLAVEVS